MDEFKNTIISSETKNSDNINYLFEKIIEENNISYFKVRTLFVCLLDTLEKTAREYGINKTALIIVGKTVLQTEFEKSRLYAPDFSTGYRKGQES